MVISAPPFPSGGPAGRLFPFIIKDGPPPGKGKAVTFLTVFYQLVLQFYAPFRYLIV